MPNTNLLSRIHAKHMSNTLIYNYLVKLLSFISSHWLFLTILALAAILRIYNIEHLTTFSADQGRDFLQVKKILDGNLTLLGPQLGPSSSLGNIYLGPAYYYLIAPALWLFNLNPIGPSYLMALLSIASLCLTYVIGVKFISKRVAILASILFAINSDIIEQSRVALNPFPIPLFSLLALLAVLKIIKEKSAFWTWPLLMSASLAIMLQLHYLTVPFILITFSVLAIYRKFKHLVFALLSFLIAVSPQIIFELRHDFFITNQIIRHISEGQEITPLTYFKHQFTSSVQILTKAFLKTELFPILISGAFLIMLVRIFHKEKNLRLIVGTCSIYIIFSMVCSAFYFQKLQLHYFAAIYSSVIILLALVAVDLFDSFRNFFPRTVLVVVILQIIAINLLAINLIRAEGYTMPSGWNMPGIKKSVEIIASDVETGYKFNVAATLDGDTRAMPYRYLLEVQNKTPQSVEDYPTSEVIYLIARDSLEDINKYKVWEVASFHPFEIKELSQLQNNIKLYKLTKL